MAISISSDVQTPSLSIPPPSLSIPPLLDNEQSKDPSGSCGELEGRVVRYGPTSYGQSVRCRTCCEGFLCITGFPLTLLGGVSLYVCNQTSYLSDKVRDPLNITGIVLTSVGCTLVAILLLISVKCYGRNKKTC